MPFSYLPRLVALLAILFVSLFALDAFDPGLTLGQQLVDFAMHLVPALILLTVLVIAWKRELLGGILFLVIGLGLSPVLFYLNYSVNHSVGKSLVVMLTIPFPFALAGLLFLISHKLKKKSTGSVPE